MGWVKERVGGDLISSLFGLLKSSFFLRVGMVLYCFAGLLFALGFVLFYGLMFSDSVLRSRACLVFIFTF